LVYDSVDEYALVPKQTEDQFAEFEPESTIEAMENAVNEAGFTPVRLGGPLTLLQSKPDVDLIWNIGEGWGSRNREAWVPVLCELWGIPFLGSDAHTLSVSLDKHLTKQIAAQLTIPVAFWELATYKNKHIPKIDFFPIVVKPRYEGTAKGLTRSAIVYDENTLQKVVNTQWHLYKQDMLLESLLTGAEFTVALSGNPLRAHTVLERAIDPVTKLGIHVLEQKGIEVSDYWLSQEIDELKEQKIKQWALNLAAELNVLDFVRFDFKCDDKGNPHLLELNPLPTFAIDNTFAILADLEGVSYSAFLAKIVIQAVTRVLNT
jgi:D-alanine-D-alanine ligase